MRTIRQRLLIWLLGCILASALTAGAAMYATVREEANELFDYQLRQIALSIPAQLSLQPVIGDADPEKDFVAQVWNLQGELIYASHSDLILPRNPGTGFTTVSALGDKWREFSQVRHGHFVQVAQAITARDELAFGVAMRSLLPFLVLIPVLGVLIWIIVGQGLHPLKRVTQAVGQRSAMELQPLPADGIPPDLRPMLDAINDLLVRLDRSIDAQRAFVADAAHELRSPLTALKLQLQLTERAKTDEQRAAAIAKLHDRLDRAIHLVQQLLTLASYEPQMEKETLDDVNLQQLAQKVVTDQTSLAESKRIDLGVETGAMPSVVKGHAESLSIMLGNLVDNAIRYTFENGRIDVIVLKEDGHSMIRVVDTGPGIPPDERARVFDRFYRRGGTDVTGSGLGLAIVKNIANQHGAAIDLSENPMGHGLTITVKFPG